MTDAVEIVAVSILGMLVFHATILLFTIILALLSGEGIRFGWDAWFSGTKAMLEIL